MRERRRLDRRLRGATAAAHPCSALPAQQCVILLSFTKQETLATDPIGLGNLIRSLLVYIDAALFDRAACLALGLCEPGADDGIDERQFAAWQRGGWDLLSENGKNLRVSAARIEVTEQDSRGSRGVRCCLRAVRACGHVLRQRDLRGARRGVLAVACDELVDFRFRLQCEELQVLLDVAIIHVDPELVELVRRRERGIEVDRPGLALPELLPRGHRDERRDQAVRLAVLDAPDQLYARGDVPPLAAPADWQRALPLAEQVQEIVRLEQHVTELGVRESGVEPRLH